jgi:GNAT superfamily N-acetyltransferase
MSEMRHETDTCALTVSTRTVLDERTIAVVDSYWAAHLGCHVTDFFSKTPHVVRHADELADYSGLFAFYRGGAPIVSVPAACFHSVESFLATLEAKKVFSPSPFASALRALSSTIIGPATIAYANHNTLRLASGAARLLGHQDRPAADTLQSACTKSEWDHGGCAVIEQPACGVFVGDQLASLAGYEFWRGTIAHISVVTHPEFRGRGFARNAVAHIAHHALHHGLVPQYRTLEANVASMRVANALGFHSLATSVAARFPHPPSLAAAQENKTND